MHQPRTPPSRGRGSVADEARSLSTRIKLRQQENSDIPPLSALRNSAVARRAARVLLAGSMVSRYRMFYDTVVRPDLLSKMQYSNVHMIPKIEKVTVSIATRMKPTGLDNPIAAAFALELITGQQAQLTRVKRANAKYKVRPGVLEGAKVVLHGDNMYHFIDRLVTTVLPRITDFEGLDRRSFDAHGGYTIGIRDWSNFIEVESQHENLQAFGLQQTPGLGVQIVTSAASELEAHMLLSALRFPFKK